MRSQIFSHLYIEEALLGSARAESILRRFAHATVVPIADYRELFMRPRQEWRLQKDSQNLILAQRKSEFLYPGSPVTPHFGFQHFFYNTLALNCLYDCNYCYLQGMMPSANLVLFLNVEDFIDAALAQLHHTSPLYLCLSYDTDLLPLESFVPYTKLWLTAVRAHPDLTVELRTKSTALQPLHNQMPCSRFILAWTLAPQSAIDRFERKAPSLSARLHAVRTAIAKGWMVRLCLDPVLEYPDWEKDYSKLLLELRSLPVEAVHDLSIGTLRMSKQHWRQFRHVRPDYSAMGPVESHQGFVVAPPSHHHRIRSLIESELPEQWRPKVSDAFSLSS